MTTKDELTKFIRDSLWGNSEILADKLLATYDITEKSLAVLYPGDIFRRVNGQDTIVLTDTGFSGVYPSEPIFVLTPSSMNIGKWILIARFGEMIKYENQFTIVLNENGLRVG